VIAAAMTKPIYGLNGEKLALAGIDLKLESIQEQVSKNAKFNGFGEAFLFQENKNLITLPVNAELEQSNKADKLNLASLDEMPGNDGFSLLESDSSNLSFHQVT